MLENFWEFVEYNTRNKDAKERDNLDGFISRLLAGNTDEEFEEEPDVPEEVKQKIYVIKTKSFEDGRQAIDYVKDGAAVILDFRGVNHQLGQDIVNYVAGAGYVIGASLEILDNTTLLMSEKCLDKKVED